VIHKLLVCLCIESSGSLNLDDALGGMTIDTSTILFKPRSDMPLEIANLEDAYLEFTQMVDVSNIGDTCKLQVHIRLAFRELCASFIEYKSYKKMCYS
jgi:hypothetical protein